jgi:hypothetical protein
VIRRHLEAFGLVALPYQIQRVGILLTEGKDDLLLMLGGTVETNWDCIIYR